MLRRCRRLTPRTSDYLTALIITTMLPRVEVPKLQNNADPSIYHVSISAGANAEDAHGPQKGSYPLWPVHRRCLCPRVRSAYQTSPCPTSVTYDAGAELHSRVCSSSVARSTKSRSQRDCIKHEGSWGSEAALWKGAW
jgi:hypothetical protein